MRTASHAPTVKCSGALDCYKLSNREELWDVCKVTYTPKYFTLTLFFFLFNSNNYSCSDGPSVPHGVST